MQCSINLAYKIEGNSQMEYREEIRDQLLSKNKVMNNNFEMGSIVTILIPQIDQNSVDRSLLPCKIIKKQIESISWGVHQEF